MIGVRIGLRSRHPSSVLGPRFFRSESPHESAVRHSPDSRDSGDRLPLLQRVHRRAGHGPRRHAGHAGAHPRPTGTTITPTTRWVLFGHHFAAIAGAGPLIGPVLAAQFGYAPGLIWLVGGVCLAGAVHDLIILWASTRRGGSSLAEIARAEIGPVAGTTAAVAILFIVIIALAGLGLAVVNALAHSAWGTFTIGMSIPLALFIGLYMYRLRPGHDRARRRSSASPGCSLP